jgi:hypothetical protein
MLPALGLSLQSLIDKAGAYAGLASLLGLAVLSLLYFAQAREVRRLRDWAGRSPERAQELEDRVVSQASAARQTAAAPAPVAAAPAAPAPAPAAPAGRPAQTLSPAPAGVAAPALASATRFVSPAPTNVPGPAPSRPPATPADEGAGPVTTVSPAATVAPATAAGARSGPPPRPDTGNGRTQPPPSPPARTLPPRSSSAPAAVRLSGPPPRRSSRARALALAGALVLVAAAIFGAVQLFGGNDKKAAPKRAAATTPATGTKGASFNRGSVVTTVLNGTPQAGVAHTVSQRLVRFGFKEGSVTNASDQQRSATSISYFPGHRRDALAVSRALKVSNVAPVDPQTKAIACPQPACATTVVVTVGSDYASGK